MLMNKGTTLGISRFLSYSMPTGNPSGLSLRAYRIDLWSSRCGRNCPSVWSANSFLANRKLLGPGSPEVCGKFGFVSGKSGTTSYGSSSEAGGRG